MKRKIFLGENIKYLRKNNGLSIKDLSNKINVPYSTLCCWENGIRTPKLETIMEFVDFFGVSLTDIVSKDLSKEK